LEGLGEDRSATAMSSISEASLLRFTRELPVELDGSALTPSLLKGFELEDSAGAEEVILILGRDSVGAGCGFGVDVREGFDDSESGALFSSDLEDAGVDVPSLARRLARIYIQ
jgi:hypothetical protein